MKRLCDAMGWLCVEVGMALFARIPDDEWPIGDDAPRRRRDRALNAVAGRLYGLGGWFYGRAS